MDEYCLSQPLCVDLLDLLHDLEQPSATGDAVCFEGRGHSQTDGLLCTACISYDQIRGERVEVTGAAFRTRVIAFKIYARK